MIAALLAAGCRKAKPPTGPEMVLVEAPELLMEGMRVQSFGTDGLEWEMNAPMGAAFTHKNFMRVNDLRVEIFKSGEKSSDISADQGIMSTANDGGPMVEKELPVSGVRLEPGDMFMSGNVVVVSTEGNRLVTDWVHYKKKVDLIVSSAPVQVVRADSVTQGVGLEATSDLENLKIFNQTLVIKEDEKKKEKPK